MYNSIIDNREYYHYRDILIEKGAKVNATITVVTEEEEDPKGEEIIEETKEHKK